MAFLSNLGTNISSKSKEVAKKAREMADIANMNSQISAQERLNDRAYLEIGKMYFADNKNNMSTPYEEKMNSIRASMEQIDRLKASINLIKQAGNDDNKVIGAEGSIERIQNGSVCPNCKAVVTSEMRFCVSCGQDLTAVQQLNINSSKKICPICNKEASSSDQIFCDECGSKL